MKVICNRSDECKESECHHIKSHKQAIGCDRMCYTFCYQKGETGPGVCIAVERVPESMPVRILFAD